MTARRVALPAKLSPPRLVHALPRERLFGWIDANRVRPGLWLCGRPGAGKTMLAAAYVRSRALPCLWYRLDADDNDTGRFFSLLGTGVAALGVRARLPLFAAEHLAQPRSYARAWFRAAFAALPRPVLLVFDNVEQAALPVLPQLLATALEEATEGICLLMTSRHAPPPELAGAVLGEALAVLAPAQLEFTPLEADAYAQALDLDPATVRAAALRVGGWAAGLRLLSHAPPSAEPDAPAPLLFDYFAGVLYDGLAPPVRHLLQVGALLPWMPGGLVAELAGLNDAGDATDATDALERLCTHNLFTERVARGVYRLHPLLRDFLLDRGRTSLAPVERAALLSRASHAFLALGHTDVAIDLAFDAGDHASAAALWLSVLEDKLARGQLDQLGAWYERVPAAVLQQHPLMLYGRARVCFLREEAAAAGHYERACAAFEALGDRHGQQLCAAGVLEWSYNSDTFIGHERWCALLAGSLAQPLADRPHSEVHALRLLNGQLLACFFRGDFRHDAPAWTDRVLAVLVPGGAENEKLSAAITLLGCMERDKRWDAAQLLAHRMQALLASPRVGPRLAILVRQQIASDLHRQTGNFGEARSLALAARALAVEHGFAVLEFEAVAILLLAAQYSGDDVETQRLLGEMAAMLAPGNVYHERFSRQQLAWHALQLGRVDEAHDHANALRAAVARSDMPAWFRATWLLLAIFVRFAEGEHAQACDELARLSEEAEAGSRDTLRANLLGLQAWRHWHAGRFEQAEQELARAWELAASVRYYQLLAPLRSELAQLAAFALERNVGAEFTRELIRRRRLAAPAAASAQWPWPVRIFTLGRFAVQVDAAALVFAGKVPRKPLALLKALIAFGGQSVAQHRLTDALWPDDDADAAQDAFNVALHRLRKLLPRGAEAIVLHDGCVSLDARLCWSDARAFELLTAPASAAAHDEPTAAALQQAMALYAGHFLADEPDAPWSISMRERLRSRFSRAVVVLGRTLEADARHEQALGFYRQGLDIDDLDEQFHQGVMRCALQLQRPAEGLAAYQRLKRMLSILLGAAPSEPSEALHRALRR